MVAINQTFGDIALVTQYNLQGGYFFASLPTVKRFRRSYYTPVNRTEYSIEQYNMFNTKGCPDDLIFGDFNNEPIPSTYSDIKNYYDDNGTQIYTALPDNKGVEDAVVPNNENNDDGGLASNIDPPKTNIL